MPFFKGIIFAGQALFLLLLAASLINSTVHGKWNSYRESPKALWLIPALALGGGAYAWASGRFQAGRGGFLLRGMDRFFEVLCALLGFALVASLIYVYLMRNGIEN